MLETNVHYSKSRDTADEAREEIIAFVNAQIKSIRKDKQFQSILPILNDLKENYVLVRTSSPNSIIKKSHSLFVFVNRFCIPMTSKAISIPIQKIPLHLLVSKTLQLLCLLVPHKAMR